MKTKQSILLYYLFSAGIVLLLLNSCHKLDSEIPTGKSNALPIVSTKVVINISDTTAISGGNITSDGGFSVNARGVCWSKDENPTIEDSKTNDGTGTGRFISNLTELETGNTYYLRAYATNSIGTAYGEQKSFTATFTCGDSVTFTYNGQSVNYSTVIGANGRCWLDRNLGATQAATYISDAKAYGDLYQWGRAFDGHQIPTSDTTTTLSNSDTTTHGNFILATNSPRDWRSPQNNNLWQGVSGVNNPCPPGWRIPTEAEWNAERQSWISKNSAGAFSSPLKLPVAGYRNKSDGSIFHMGSDGLYWSSTTDDIYSRLFYFHSSDAIMRGYYRAEGGSIRCIKD